MAIIKGSAGDFFNDSIAFTVEVLLGSEEKKDGIDKEGDSVGGRGKLRCGKKNAAVPIKCGPRSERASRGHKCRG